MRRIDLIQKLNSALYGLAALVLLTFGSQAIMLPVHSIGHSVQRAVAESSAHDAKISEADCEVCEFASHQAVGFSSVEPFETSEAVGVRNESFPSRPPMIRLSILPPVRGPPASINHRQASPFLF